MTPLPQYEHWYSIHTWTCFSPVAPLYLTGGAVHGLSTDQYEHQLRNLQTHHQRQPYISTISTISNFVLMAYQPFMRHLGTQSRMVQPGSRFRISTIHVTISCQSAYIIVGDVDRPSGTLERLSELCSIQDRYSIHRAMCIMDVRLHSAQSYAA